MPLVNRVRNNPVQSAKLGDGKGWNNWKKPETVSIMIISSKQIVFIIGLCSVFHAVTAQQSRQLVFDRTLHNLWMIQSAQYATDSGSLISTKRYIPKAWYPTTVPHTVLGALVDDQVYKHIFFDQRLSTFSDTPFNHPWWYRTSFRLESFPPGQQVMLRFNGINYRADVWLNGRLVASADTLAGSFRRFDLDITPFARAGTNILAVEVSKPQPGDLAIGFVDWNPEPADHDMGIWRDVHLLVTGEVSLAQPFVRTQVDSATLEKADITLSTLVQNHSDKRVEGVLSASIGNHIHVSQSVILEPGQSKMISFAPDGYPALHMAHPRLWWTYELGKPNLYHLHLAFRINHTLSDQKDLDFGIRTITGYMTPQGFRGYRLNGKNLLIKGGGWTDPMLLNASSAYEKAGIEYAVQMHLNAIRMEGFWGHDQHIFNLCDRYGVLVMAGFSCQWEWQNSFGAPQDQYGCIKTPLQINIAVNSFADQITWLRNHPSIFLWLYGSDKWPRPELESGYLGVLSQDDPTRPYAQSAAEHTSVITGPSGMKMRGPYDYVPPDYWYIDHRYGGAFGFNTETSPGPEIPVLESLKRMIPADSLWPISSAWMYHAARGNFHNLTHYNQAMDQRLGPPEDLTDYLRKAQYLNYEGARAMFEAFEANRFRATGIIQWMYNASWPKLWWQLYDYYLVPTGAFYGTRRACEPIHIAYNYGSAAIDLENNTLMDVKNLKAEVTLLNFNLSPVMSTTIAVKDLGPQQTLVLDTLDTDHASPTYFLRLNLRNDSGTTLSRNFYVLSQRKDLLDTKHSTWFITPESQFADLTALQQLPMADLEVTRHIERHADSTMIRIKLRNPGKNLAFMVYLDLVTGKDNPVVPVFWKDNYITLLPGEERTVNGYCFTRDLDGQPPRIKVSGWNVREEKLP